MSYSTHVQFEVFVDGRRVDRELYVQVCRCRPPG